MYPAYIVPDDATHDIFSLIQMRFGLAGSEALDLRYVQYFGVGRWIHQHKDCSLVRNEAIGEEFNEKSELNIIYFLFQIISMHNLRMYYADFNIIPFLFAKKRKNTPRKKKCSQYHENRRVKH
jgi:hypothetical protein